MKALLYAKSRYKRSGSQVLPLLIEVDKLRKSHSTSYFNNPDYTILLVIIDENNDIDEINENNNQGTYNRKSKQRLYVTESYISQMEMVLKDETQLDSFKSG
jgi:hypothetical protein